MRGLFLATWWLVLVFGPASGVAEGQTGEKPIWLVVTRPMFVGAIRPLAERRAEEGFETVVSTESPEKAIAGLKRGPAFIVLVGDDLAPGSADKPWSVPMRRMELYRWQFMQAKMFASDMAWGDLDGDGMPDVPVSRMPVRTVEEVQRMIGKIVAWEERPVSVDDLSLAVWAGTPGYGPEIDSLATALLMATVEGSAPSWAEMWAISCDRKSPYCGWPADQPAMFDEQTRKGGLCLCMIGHGVTWSFPAMGGGSSYEGSHAAKAFAKGPPAPPLVVLACHCGNCSEGTECLTRALALAPGGPVAAIGATTTSHPLTNFYSGECFLESLGSPGEKRIGSMWLASERRARKAYNFLVEPVLMDVEGKLEDRLNVEKLRRDQTLMYALLGDGATRLRTTMPMKVDVTHDADGWHWRADKPTDATELSVGLRPEPVAATPVEGTPDREQARKNFIAANAGLVFQPIAKLPPGAEWQGTVPKPGTLRLVAMGPGKLYVATTVLKEKKTTTRGTETPPGTPAPR
jgi:hypothetical protein